MSGNACRCLCHTGVDIRHFIPCCGPGSVADQIFKDSLCDDEGCPHHGTDHICVPRAPLTPKDTEHE